MKDRSSVDCRGSVNLSARTVPMPGSLSAEAQALFLLERPARIPQPPASDKAAWREFIRQTNDTWAPFLRQRVARLEIPAETQTIAGVTVYVIQPAAIPSGNADKALLFFHGGGMVTMAGDCTRSFGIMEAASTRCRVFAVDFRNPPDHPYPAALDDCIAVYRQLISMYRPASVAISGVSGGGNLAAAVPLKLRDLGLPLPGALGLFTPEVDLTESGDTFETNRDIDVVLPERITNSIELYANGHDLRDPYLSPLFANFASGFPPTFIQAGTRDLFLSNAVRFHRALRRAGIEAELHLGEGMPHGGFGGAPEDIELREEFVSFLSRTAGWAPP